MPPVSGAGTERECPLSIDQHRTDQVYAVIRSLVEDGRDDFRPGHIAEALREAGQPMLGWEIRMELARLVEAGLIAPEPESGSYRLTGAVRKAG